MLCAGRINDLGLFCSTFAERDATCVANVLLTGRINDLGLLCSTFAERDANGRYTPEADAVLATIARYT
jgi:hypothetical protein